MSELRNRSIGAVANLLLGAAVWSSAHATSPLGAWLSLGGFALMALIAAVWPALPRRVGARERRGLRSLAWPPLGLTAVAVLAIAGGGVAIFQLKV